MREHVRIFTDMEALMETSEDELGGDESLRSCCGRTGMPVGKGQENLVGFATRHKVVIDRVGLHPHRNKGHWKGVHQRRG